MANTNKPKPATDNALWGADRLVGFSDGVMAIAVTLLILPLVNRVASLHNVSLHSLVKSSGQQFLIFFISFVVICRYWLVHNSLFSRTKMFDLKIFWLNVLWLLTIVFIPFPTELIGKTPNSTSIVTGLYIGTIWLTSVCSLAIILQVNKLNHLEHSEKTSLANTIAAIILLTIAFIVAVASPSIGAFSLLLLFLSNPVAKLLKWSILT
jgi:uncharacterized membrane protein